jgi:hypothetical protein
MTNERFDELMKTGGPLTDKELAAGWHFCPDWDYLLIRAASEGECICKQ